MFVRFAYASKLSIFSTCMSLVQTWIVVFKEEIFTSLNQADSELSLSEINKQY